MLSKIEKTAAALVAAAFLLAATADDATVLRVPLSGHAKLPAPGANVPMKLPMTSQKAFPIDLEPSAAVALTGKAATSPKVTGQSTLKSAPVGPMAYSMGQEKWPYTTARVASTSSSLSNAALDNPVTATPYRQTGLLLVNFPGGPFPGLYQCSASLIMPNVLVTAAHCVQDFGLGNLSQADTITWVPANTGNPTDPADAPFGIWEANGFVVSSTYADGTDTCAKNGRGVVCNNDIALVSLKPQGTDKAAAALGGAYMYGWNGYSYIKSPAFKNLTVADITELGYPVAFDDGLQMQRNNSLGKFVTATGRQTTTRKPLLNTLLGSPLSGGSSGGPWLVNFGTRPDVDPTEANLGYGAEFSNTVVGVTSYGYVDPGLNVQGASFFGQNFEFPAPAYGIYGAGNIGALMNYMCTVADPAACVP